MITVEPFVGVEVEGPERGEHTLFIPRSFRESVVDLLAQYPGVRRVYYGAGEDFGISEEQSVEACTLHHTHTVLVEVDWKSLVRDIDNINRVKARVVIVNKHKALALKNIKHDVLTWVQFTDDQLVVCANSIHDPMYKGDEHAVRHSD